MNARSAEEPLLWLALLGFAPDEELAIWSALEADATAACWRPGDLSTANACLVHGGRIEHLGDSRFDVLAGPPNQQSVRIDLQEMSRPVAFASPVPTTLQVRHQFSLEEPEAICQAVSRLRGGLLALRTRFALGREIVRAGPSLRHGAFQLLGADGNLLAQLDFRIGRAALSQLLTAADVEVAKWSKTGTLRDVPADFVVMATAELSWTYAKHSEVDLLPSSYYERPVFYRGPPRVPLGWLSDGQLAVLTELTANPQMLEELAARTRMPIERAVAALTPLYFASAITSSPSKAALEWHRRVGYAALSTGGDPAPSIAPENAEPPGFQASTVPGALRPR
ncbi:hypothetical protein ACPWT1_22510 [Ramlibacter sp. MMS24-I3-19]|uniref:hypothetical protein n=1 Tax=Ramlibacter sp. MMS24-I3-19 TaxID=3416606 RepID=UPI003D01B92D